MSIVLIPKNQRTRLLWAILIAVGATAAISYQYLVSAPNTYFNDESRLFYIPRSLNDTEVIEKLSREGIISHSRTMRGYLRVTGKRDFQPGRYRIQRGMSNAEIVHLLTSGRQEPVLVRLNNLRSVHQLAGRLAQYLESDSITFDTYLVSPPRMNEVQLSPEEYLTLFIGGQDSMKWNSHPQDIFRHFLEKHNAYWNSARRGKAKKLGLTPTEVYILASIVKGEVVKMEEAPRIAGLYLNRLKKGMLLQADPTVVFATGGHNVRRVWNSDLKIDSPYNTYLYGGLPPGPIFLTESDYLDAVLTAENHSYIYMCAKPGYAGEHEFASSYSEHQMNARVYRDWLNKEKIVR